MKKGLVISQCSKNTYRLNAAKILNRNINVKVDNIASLLDQQNNKNTFMTQSVMISIFHLFRAQYRHSGLISSEKINRSGLLSKAVSFKVKSLIKSQLLKIYWLKLI